MESTELFKSAFILWKKGMKPVVVTRHVRLDIIPTLSNLSGWNTIRACDGQDILSDSEPLVIFATEADYRQGKVQREYRQG